jgi:signal transduction histidine kinase
MIGGALPWGTMTADAIDLAVMFAALEDDPDALAVARTVLDADGALLDLELIYANRNSRQRAFDARPLEALRGARVFERFPTLRGDLFDLFANAVRGGERLGRVVRGTGAVHSQWWVEVSVTPFPGGVVYRSHNMRTSEVLQQGVFDALAEAVVVQDVQGRFVLANRAAQAVLGTSGFAGRTGDALGFALLDTEGRALPPDERPSAVSLAAGRPVHGALLQLVRGRDEPRRWVRINAEPLIGERGEIQGVVTSFTDVTQERALEESVRRMQRLESMGRVAAAAAHDFNNVLTGIRMVHELLESSDVAQGPLATDIVDLGQMLDQGARLTGQLLRVGREGGTGATEVLDALEVVETTERLLRGVAAPSRLQVETRVVGRVRVARQTLEQALLNLVVNARDAMAGQPGLIRIETGTETLAGDAEADLPAGPFVVVSVEDDGPGMPPEVLERALEPFFTTKPQGTGLGLAGVYGAFREAGGTVRIHSTVGHGTRVELLLPRVG